MHKIVDEKGKTYNLYSYGLESEFEEMVVANVDAIFGKDFLVHGITLFLIVYQVVFRGCKVNIFFGISMRN